MSDKITGKEIARELLLIGKENVQSLGDSAKALAAQLAERARIKTAEKLHNAIDNVFHTDRQTDPSETGRIEIAPPKKKSERKPQSDFSDYVEITKEIFRGSPTVTHEPKGVASRTNHRKGYTAQTITSSNPSIWEKNRHIFGVPLLIVGLSYSPQFFAGPAQNGNVENNDLQERGAYATNEETTLTEMPATAGEPTNPAKRIETKMPALPSNPTPAQKLKSKPAPKKEHSTTFEQVPATTLPKKSLEEEINEIISSIRKPPTYNSTEPAATPQPVQDSLAPPTPADVLREEAIPGKKQLTPNDIKETASFIAIPQTLRRRVQHQIRLDQLERNPAFRALKEDFMRAEQLTDVPWDLIALIAASETRNFDTKAENASTHACGLMQTKPDSLMAVLYEKLGNPHKAVSKVEIWKDAQGRVVSYQPRFDRSKATKYFLYEAAGSTAEERQKNREKISTLCAKPSVNLVAGAENFKTNADRVFRTVLNDFHRIPTYADAYLTHILGKEAILFLELTKDPARRHDPLSKYFPEKAAGNPFLFNDPKRSGKGRSVIEAYEFVVREVMSNERLPNGLWEHHRQTTVPAPSREL